MSPLALILEGVTLGQKHEHYNRVVKATTADETFILESISHDDNDIDNLLKIDVACARRDVGYVLEVLRGGDALYVARALRRSAWLLADDEYAHIINPHHLHRDLFPKITTKVKSRLLLAIRLNLNNEARVDEFYNFFKDDTKFAQKWLLRCSDALVMSVLERDAKSMDVDLMKRLCRKSLAILKTCCETCPSPHWLKSSKAFLYTHSEGYLELLRAAEENNVPKFGKKVTRLLMNIYPDTILEQFHKYCYKLDLPEFAKHLSTEAIQDILLKQIRCDRYEVRSWCRHTYAKHLIRCIPEDQRYQFVQEIFLDRGKAEVSNGTNIEKDDGESTDLYPWYRYVPFETAFSKLKDLIFDRRCELAEGDFHVFELLLPTGSSYHSIWAWILKILVRSARGNLHHIQTLLHYYRDNHVIELYDDPISSILCTITKTHKYDETTWNMLNEIFYGMGIYREDKNLIFPYYCIQAIVLYNILHDKHIPKNIEQKIKLHNFRRTLSQKLAPDESAKVFAYLYNYASNQLVTKKINHISELKVALSKCSELLWFLEAWKKDVAEFPLLVNKIRELIKIKNDNTWGTNPKLCKVFSQFYKEHRHLRIHLFQESFFLSLSDETCLNALKHDPDLFSRHKGWTEAIASTDAVSLRRTLMKLRIYWPHSMAKQWADAFINGLEQPTAAHKICVEGHFILVPRKEALVLVYKYIPEVIESDGKYAKDSMSFNIPRYILMYMHLIRPAVSLGRVWSYVERRYPRSVVQLLDYVLINTCRAETSPYVTKLLNKTGPLQKLGIRYLLCNQFDINESKQIILNVWNNTTSYSVKCGVFKHIYKFLIKQKRRNEIENAWDILREIIDNITAEFYESLKTKIDAIEKVPKIVRLRFFMKSYLSLVSYLMMKEQVIITWYMRCNVGNFDVNFVEKLMIVTMDHYTEDNERGYRNSDRLIDLLRFLTKYLTTNDGIESQQIKFEKLFVPLMERFLMAWPNEKSTFCKSRQNHYNTLFRRFLESLSLNVSKRLSKHFVVPSKLFKNIQNSITDAFTLEKEYYLITFWNITVTFVDVLENFSKSDIYHTFIDKMPHDYYYYYQYEIPEFEEMYLHVAPEFGKACINYFQQDSMLSQYPALFPVASKSCMSAFVTLSFPYSVINKTLIHMLHDEKSETLYHVANGVIRCMYLNAGNGEYKLTVDEELKNIILSHPSRVIRTHYHHNSLEFCVNFSEEHSTDWTRSGFMNICGPNDKSVY